MGRRKIEIKPIRDDRNRSVTFLKRKGGLFKKAHELSVLCSVDVAVIVFAPNKKLYEYSSSDVNEIVGRFQYYGGAHEHKGPSDFADKHGGGDDEEDEDAVESEGRGGTPGPDPAMMGMQQHPGFQHVRHATPSGSPPMNNGGMPQFQRQQSPMGAAISRPSSQASQHQGHIRRVSSNLVPPNHPQHPQNAQHPPQGAGYAYTPNPPYYNPHQQMQRQAQHPPGQATYPPPFPQQQQQHPQMQIVQDTRRQSMPPQYPQQHAPQANMQQRHPSHDHLQPPQQHPQQPQHHPQQPQHHPQQPQHHPQQPQHQQQPSHGLPQQQNPPGPVNSPRPPPPPQEQVSPPLPQPKPLPAHAKSHSIFTPIDDSRSMLAQHWGSTSNAEPARMDPAVKLEPEGPRAQSIDIAAMQRDKEAMPRPNGMSPRPPPARPMPRSPPLPQRTNSTPSVPNTRAPNRQSAQPSDPAKRPRLKVQIPSEHSGDEGGTGSAPDDTSTSQPGTGPQGQPTASQSQQTAPAHGVVLPPPSPSAGALLSAGAQGPPNPFARPAPPMSTNPHALNRDTATAPNPNIETPISALPSRFMSDNLLPSPSTFYPEWGFGRQGDGNTLPSPLNFQTPVGTGQGQGWQQGGGRGDEDSRKRAADEEADRAGGGDGVKRSRS